MADQKVFATEQRLPFSVLADREGKITEAYGVAIERNGRTYASRVTFLIDKKGVVRKVFEVKDIAAHPAEALKAFADLKSKPEKKSGK